MASATRTPFACTPRHPRPPHQQREQPPQSDGVAGAGVDDSAGLQPSRLFTQMGIQGGGGCEPDVPQLPPRQDLICPNRPPPAVTRLR